MPSTFAPRTALIAILALLVFATSGCSWFRKSSPYRQTAETRPLEVPPDLDRPSTAGAMALPGEGTGSVTRSSIGAAAAADSATAFSVPGAQRDAVYARIGEVLAATEGASITGQADLLGTYDVSYRGSSFLVRAAQAGDGVQVSAVDGRGVAAAGEAPAALIAVLKAALGR